jgi:hypothetical protein
VSVPRTAPWRRALLLLRRSPAELLAIREQTVRQARSPDALQFADRVLYLADGEHTERSP